MHDRPLFRQLRGDGNSVRGIAREHGASRNAVRRALADGARDRYWRSSASEEVEEAVRDVLADYPHMTVGDIAVMVDWQHARRTLSDVVARLRPEYALTPEAEAPPLAGIRTGRLGPLARLQVGTLTIGEVEW